MVERLTGAQCRQDLRRSPALEESSMGLLKKTVTYYLPLKEPYNQRAKTIRRPIVTHDGEKKSSAAIVG